LQKEFFVSKQFISANRQQAYLLPPSLDEWLPQKHLSRFIIEIVEQLNLTSIYKQYQGKGGKRAYRPEVLLSLLFYGYATGAFSSRKIEAATYDSIAFRFISANTHPDHDTIANFRQRFLVEIEELFIEVLLIAKDMKMVQVGKVSLDGTKLKANASKSKALSYAYIERLEEQLRQEVQTLLQRAEEVDELEGDEEMDIPEELERREDRLEAIKDAKRKIEQRAKERLATEKEKHEQKMQQRRAKEKKSGKKSRGPTPALPTLEIKGTDQVNLTDPESRIMLVSTGGFQQSYNAQASVEHDSRLIVHQHLTNHPVDKQEIVPTLEYFNEHTDFKPKELLADAGYMSETNVEACEKADITPYISLRKEKHNQTLEERFRPTDPLPENPTALEKMRYRLQTKEGKVIYALRKSTVETVFGVIKHVIGFRQLLLRGLQKSKGEWSLVCLAYNLKRMHTLRAE
jgi:transposase